MAHTANEREHVKCCFQWSGAHTLTRVIVPPRSHPAEALAIGGHIAEVAVRQDAGVQPDQAAAAIADAGQIEAGALAEDDVHDGGAHVGGAVQAVGHGVGAAACRWLDVLVI